MNNNQQQRPEASAQPTATPPRKTLVSVLFRRWRREVSSDLRPDRETRAIASMKIMVFANVMLILALIGLLLPLRPTTSELEKRELTKLPKFTFSAFLSGEYFAGIETWYADTYPFREQLVAMDNSIKSLYGIRTEQIIGEGQGEDIPDVDITDDPDYSGGITDDAGEGSQSGNPDGSVPTLPDDPAPDFDTVTDVVTGESNTQYQTGDVERIDSLYRVGDTAYEVYYFNQKNAIRYAGLINKAAKQLEGSATVYSMIIPLSYSVELDAATQKQIGASDAASAIDFMYSQMKGVKKIGVLNNLIAHNSEYLYFRTDHHWTARGAYYAYACYCAARGWQPNPLSSFEEFAFEGFLGTLYSAARQPAELAANPDIVYAYMPNGAFYIQTTQKNGNVANHFIVNPNTDTFYAAAASKYNTFLGGDHPLGYIHNDFLSDGSSVVVVKESYGNAFVPFLVDHYEHVYVIDYRYYTDGTLADFVKANGVKDVIFINNLSATGTTARLDNIESLLGE